MDARHLFASPTHAPGFLVLSTAIARLAADNFIWDSSNSADCGGLSKNSLSRGVLGTFEYKCQYL